MRNKVLALTMGLSLLMSPVATFAANGTTGVMDSDPSVSQETKLKLEKEAMERDKVIMKWAREQEEKANKAKLNGEIGTLADPDGEFYSITVTNFKQERDYWCGPAAARQTLSFHKAKSGSGTALPSQTTLSSQIGTENQKASSSYGIRTALNSYSSTFGFGANPYGVADIANTTNPTATFESRIKYVLSQRINAPVILIDTRYLPRYNGAYYRHYNTVSGYSYEYATNKKQVKTVDPHYSSLYLGAWWDPLGSTTVNGVVRAVYIADVNGDNPAMVY